MPTGGLRSGKQPCNRSESNRKEQDAYRSFRTHYLIDSNFCNPAAGYEKGSVENLVGFAQRNIVGPRLEVESWEQLAAVLWERCLKYAERVPRGEIQTVLERGNRSSGCCAPFPDVPTIAARPYR